ncbi:MAG: GYD domain-containing protein [Verrucomicrobiae bacterium]|nr:GYD domain-containing protein [Verrucomicrobiae bacterium]
MASYIMLNQMTRQGVNEIQDSPKRAEAAVALGKKMGVKLTDIFWTLGGYDTVCIAEAPDDETMAAFAVSLCRQGYIKTQTLRAFRANEVRKILRRLG